MNLVVSLCKVSGNQTKHAGTKATCTNYLFAGHHTSEISHENRLGVPRRPAVDGTPLHGLLQLRAQGVHRLQARPDAAGGVPEVDGVQQPGG